jgi:hypothetical protein
MGKKCGQPLRLALLLAVKEVDQLVHDSCSF